MFLLLLLLLFRSITFATLTLLYDTTGLSLIDTPFAHHAYTGSAPSLPGLEGLQALTASGAHLYPRMRISAGARDALLLAHYATAISIPALQGEKNMEKKSLSRRADEESNVTIPLAISIGPSQYWDGNGA